MGTSGQIIDTDLMSSNIRSGVDIFGIAGTLSIWWLLWNTTTNILGSWFQEDLPYTSSYWDSQWRFIADMWTDIYIIFWWGYAGGAYWIIIWVYKYNKSSWLISFVWVNNDTTYYTSAPGFGSWYVDWTNIVINTDWYLEHRKFTIDTTTDIISNSNNNSTTGTLISDSLSYLWNTISVWISEVIDTNIIPNTYWVTWYYTLS